MSNSLLATRSDDAVDFGYRKVSARDKTRLVGEVFTSVADSYDLMNDLMSFGIHRLWKRHFVATSRARNGEAVLDLAGGTGDIAALLAPRVAPKGSVTVADINHEMLAVGRDRLLDRGLALDFVQADAQTLPFPAASFDLMTMAFGLRNVTDKATALAAMRRCLKPGGRLQVLEFSQVTLKTLKPLYDLYSFQVLPRLGKVFAGDAESYQYLAESIRRHPPQLDLQQMFEAAGLEHTRYRNLSAGLVAIHTGYAL